MTKRSLNSLRDEMRAVARGDRTAPEWLKSTPVPAPDAISVMTAANRQLMQLIALHKPDTVSDLARLADRKQSNVSRSLQDLARHGLVRLVRDGMSIRPEIAVQEVKVDVAHGTYELVAVG